MVQEAKTRKEICDILGIKSVETLKKIETRGTLQRRLNDKGYELISKEKKGRSYVYNVQEINSSKKTYSDVCNNVFHTIIFYFNPF